MAAARRKSPAKKPPVEYSILYTAMLCLLAFGAVMVYSASSAESLLVERRSGLLPEALRGARRGRAGRAARDLAARPASAQGADAAGRHRRLRADVRGDAAGHRRDRERRDALARRRPAAVPAVGDPEVRADPLHGAAAVGAAEAARDARRPVQAAPAGRRRAPACCCSSSRTWGRRWSSASRSGCC